MSDRTERDGGEREDGYPSPPDETSSVEDGGATEGAADPDREPEHVEDADHGNDPDEDARHGSVGADGAERSAAAPTTGPDETDAGSGEIAFIPRITIGSFAETDEGAAVFAALAGDRRMARAALDRHRGGLAGAIDTFEGGPTPDLILAETALAGDALFDALERLAALCPEGTRLILIGRDNDVALYRRLLKFGVGDYLVLPIEPLEVIDAVAQLFQEGEAETLGKVTAFFGVRGGVGTSTVARNVAGAMAHGCESSVLIADMDLAFGTAAFDLDLEPLQGIRDALDEGERLDETLIDRLITRRDDRIGLLAAPASLKLEGEPAPEVVQLLLERARTLTPHLLLDLPHCWSDWVRKALHLVDEIVLVATPDLPALRNARNLAAAARAARRNDPEPRLVLNQVGMPKRREARRDDFERVIQIEPLAEVPFDGIAFAEAAMKGELVAETRANAAAAEAFDTVAQLLTGRQVTGEKPRRSGLTRLFRRSA